MLTFLARLGAALQALGSGVREMVRDRWEWVRWDLLNFWHHSRVVHPFRAGHWLARIMDDMGWPAWANDKDADAIPSYRYMRWNTRDARSRHVSMEEQRYYWSETGHAGTVPNVESWLHPYDVVTWFGRRYTIWRLEIAVQVWVRNDPLTLSRVWYGVDEDLLMTMFVKYQSELRDTLKGESRPVHELRKLHAVA